MRQILPLINIKKIGTTINHSCKKQSRDFFFTKRITGQILSIDKYQENTRQIFVNNSFKKKETNICNWCIKKVRDMYFSL